MNKFRIEVYTYDGENPQTMYVDNYQDIYEFYEDLDEGFETFLNKNKIYAEDWENNMLSIFSAEDPIDGLNKIKSYMKNGRHFKYLDREKKLKRIINEDVE